MSCKCRLILCESGGKVYFQSMLHSFKYQMASTLWISLMIMAFVSKGHGQIDVLANRTFKTEVSGISYAIKYYTSYLLSQVNDEIKHAVIVVHGTNRNADDYFDNMKFVVETTEGRAENTVVVAPQFLTEEDIDAFDLDEVFPYWSSDGWKTGSNSRNEESNPRNGRIPSFELMDSLIMQVLRAFPAMETLIFTGHSAGGQFTNRYTASSPIFNVLCNDFNVDSKSVIANPGSYLYMSPKRRVSNSNREFAIPNTTCDDYNDYSYGLEDLFTYHRRAGADQIKEWYGSRQVIYLLGEDDNDPNASTLPTSCRAQLLGDHRLERGLTYYQHILDTYGSDVMNLHQLTTVPNVGHSHTRMYQSEEGRQALFDPTFVNVCSDQTTPINETNFTSLSLYPNPFDSEIHISGITSRSTVTIRLYHVSGQLLHEGQLRKSIDLSHLNLVPGVYFIQILQDADISWFKIVRR